MEYEDKYNRLKEILGGMNRVLVAFSGGVDSTLLLKAAKDTLGENVLAVTAVSEIQTREEMEQAGSSAGELDVEHILIHTEEMKDSRFVSNPENRCYYCKKMIFNELIRIAKKRKIPFIADGSNADDMNDIRPGRKALEELGIRSPLAEAGLTKEDIRLLSRKLSLPTWDKPALACLASRIPFGTPITSEKLRRIEQAESFLRKKGLRQVRVRDHGETARIEALPEDFPLFTNARFSGEIVNRLRSLGYIYVTLDLRGYLPGSLHEMVRKNG